MEEVEAGEATRADIARRERIGRARVTQSLGVSRAALRQQPEEAGAIWDLHGHPMKGKSSGGSNLDRNTAGRRKWRKGDMPKLRRRVATLRRE